MISTGRGEFVRPGRPPPSPCGERRPPGPRRATRGWINHRCSRGWHCVYREKKGNPLKTEASLFQESFIERLPSEILMKILSYLDASSLFCMSHVSKCFHQIANDDVMWHKIYMSEFGSQTWEPKLVHGAAQKVDAVGSRDQLAGHWKRMYLITVAGQEMNKWRREMREVSPFTGLPRRTEWVLRNLNLSWELTVCENLGWENVLKQSRLFFLKSSMIIRWSGSCFPKYHHIRTLQLHAVRREAQRSLKAKKPGWRSLISKIDLRTQPGRVIGTDSLIKMVHVSPGFIIGIWRGDSSVAFIMVSLHFHKLVERSLLGFPACPYSEPVDLLRVDTSDPELGLCGYTLNLALHNTTAEIMSGCFHQLSCHRGRIKHGRVELKVIDRANLSQHRLISGNVKLLWRSEELEGSVENCCIITLTLLDEFEKPFWCVSSPICITMAKEKKKLSFDYSGEHFLMEYGDPEGQVKMGLVWLKEQKQFFVISLDVYIPVSKVNRRFRSDY